jgi:hypothetical protein
MLKTVRILAVPAVGWSAGRFYVSYIPWFRPENSKKGRGVESAGPLLNIIGLLDYATLPGPEALERENQILKSQNISSAKISVTLK